ncbi:hypothetical protein P8971_23650 [Serratia marcescens]|uniref:hypothetical protein n=1 Tax=Serratia marcescens TaxID=615 RepID=UPI0032048014
MSEKKITQEKDVKAETNTEAGYVNLPFAEPRTKLLAEYVPNAVPRSGSYQQWLTEHYDMAYSLGLEKGDDGEEKQGDGLTLNTTTNKLAVKHDASLKTPGGVLGVNINSTGGLTTSGNNGLEVKLHTGGEAGQRYAGVIKSINEEGLYISVGEVEKNERRGLRGYKGTHHEGGAVLGIDHDNSLTFNAAGQVGAKINSSGGISTDISGGLKLALHPGAGDQYYAGVIKVDSTAGLWVNVASGAQRRGLVGYRPAGANSDALGIDNDNSLKFDETNGKVGVKLHTTGGLTTSGNNGLALNLRSDGTAGNHYVGAIKSTNKDGVFINVGTGGYRRGLAGHMSNVDGVALGIDADSSLKFNGNGQLGVKLSTNTAHDFLAPVLVNSTDGLSINVSKGGDVGGARKGLKHYGPVLGVDHDDSLRINTGSGQIGLNFNRENAIRLMGVFYGASHYAFDSNIAAFISKGDPYGARHAFWNIVLVVSTLNHGQQPLFYGEKSTDSIKLHGTGLVDNEYLYWTSVLISGRVLVDNNKDITNTNALSVKLKFGSGSYGTYGLTFKDIYN